MVAFDAETYLRLLGERLLQDRDPQRNHRRSPLDLPAAALVVAGAIDRRHAQRVIDDHTTALRLRAGERGFPHFGSPAGRRKPGRLTPRQTMIVNHEIAFGDGLLLFRDLAIMSTGGGSLRFRWRSNAARTGGGHSRMIGSGGGGAFPWGATAPVIADDQGNRPTVSSGSGGGSDSQWDGELTLDTTLSPTTTWLEIAGVRVPFDRQVIPSKTWIEPLEDGDPVEQFLRRRLAVADMPFGEPVELDSALDALRAAGRLAGRERLVDELEAVAPQLPGRHGRPRPHSGTPRANARRVPEPWRSLLARVGRTDGPSWTRVLGALTPPFDGIQAAFRSIISDSDGFEAEFEVAPNVLHAHALGELPVAWSARDDRGNRYLGTPGSWGGSNESASGTMRFWPALDPRATRVELVVSAQTQQAIVEIPLDTPS
jgi:hypothetical protein